MHRVASKLKEQKRRVENIRGMMEKGVYFKRINMANSDVDSKKAWAKKATALAGALQS